MRSFKRFRASCRSRWGFTGKAPGGVTTRAVGRCDALAATTSVSASNPNAGAPLPDREGEARSVLTQSLVPVFDPVDTRPVAATGPAEDQMPREGTRSDAEQSHGVRGCTLRFPTCFAEAVRYRQSMRTPATFDIAAETARRRLENDQWAPATLLPTEAFSDQPASETVFSAGCAPLTQRAGATPGQCTAGS